MGTVHAEITLKNARDEGNARNGVIKAEEVRTATVQALVDTGAMYLVINKDLCEKLGLTIIRERYALVANGERVKCEETEPVDICWKNRASTLPAVVIPGARKILLGVVPLECMDLIVNPVTRELEGAHGDMELVLAL